MSEEDEEPKPIARTNSGRVIVFDPVKRTLTTEKAKNLDSKQVSLRVCGYYHNLCAVEKVTSSEKAPKWGSRVSIYEKSGSKRMIATLNLDKLKWTENVQRHCGMITNIYIMELPTTERNPSVSQAA